VGFIRVDELLGLLDAAAILTRQPLPKGNRIGILGTGGLCVVLADTCISMGMEVPMLKEEQVKFIISDLEFPPHAPTPMNPVDFAGSNRTALQETGVLNKMAQLDSIDGLICNTPISWADSSKSSAAEQEKLLTRTAELITAIPLKLGKPVVTVGLNDIAFTSELVENAMDAAGITSYKTPETAARAMATLVKYAKIKRRFANAS
jgi:acyl-CoA synthetase (NDP forming)